MFKARHLLKVTAGMSSRRMLSHPERLIAVANIDLSPPQFTTRISAWIELNSTRFLASTTSSSGRLDHGTTTDTVLSTPIRCFEFGSLSYVVLSLAVIIEPVPAA